MPVGKPRDYCKSCGNITKITAGPNVFNYYTAMVILLALVIGLFIMVANHNIN